VTPSSRLGDVKNTNVPAFVRNRVAWWSNTVQRQQDGWGCAGGVSLTAGVRDQWRNYGRESAGGDQWRSYGRESAGGDQWHSYGRESAGAAKLAMNVLKENESIFCVQQIADC
jgi:hypothetical protein